MSYKKRTGHVERGIRYAFIAKPDRAWTTSELMEWTHGLALYQKCLTKSAPATLSAAFDTRLSRSLIAPGRQAS
jgi:hypothetical protein